MNGEFLDVFCTYELPAMIPDIGLENSRLFANGHHHAFPINSEEFSQRYRRHNCCGVRRHAGPDSCHNAGGNHCGWWGSFGLVEQHQFGIGHERILRSSL